MKKNLLKIYEGFFDDLDKLNPNQNKEDKEDKVNDEFSDVNGQVYDEHNYILSHDRNPEFFKGLCNMCKDKEIPYPLEENGFLQEDLDKITYIDSDMFAKSYFQDVTSLDELKYFNNLETILPESFYKCRKLKSVIFPENLKIIQWDSFKFCISLKKISFSKNIKIIGSGAFEGCSSLKEITIPREFSFKMKSIFYGVYLSKVNITYI